MRQEKINKSKSAVREWTESIIIAFILAMFIRTFFFQAFRIPSGSMRMTLLEGDRLLVNKLKYGARVPLTKKRLPGYGRPQRGDVVVFIYPENRKKDFIKRLIAFGGETVEISNGDIFINGKKLVDPRIDRTYYYNRGPHGQTHQKIEVPQGYYYVLGDNSGSSSDSRFWGFVPQGDLVGKAEFIYWPMDRIRFIQ